MSYNAVVSRFKDQFNTLTKSQEQIFGLFMYLRNLKDNFDKIVNPKHSYIINKKDVSSSTVKRAVKRFIEFGWLTVKRANRRKGNQYEISDCIAKYWNELKANDKRLRSPSYRSNFSRENELSNQLLDSKMIPQNAKMIPQNSKNDPSKTLDLAVENDPSRLDLSKEKHTVRAPVHNSIDKPKGSLRSRRKSLDDLNEGDKAILRKKLMELDDKQRREVGTGREIFTEDEIVELGNIYYDQYGLEQGLDKLNKAVISVVTHESPVKNKIGLAITKVK